MPGEAGKTTPRPPRQPREPLPMGVERAPAPAPRTSALTSFRSLSLPLGQPRRWRAATCPSPPEPAAEPSGNSTVLDGSPNFSCTSVAGQPRPCALVPGPGEARVSGLAQGHRVGTVPRPPPPTHTHCRGRSKSRRSGPRGGLDETGQEGAPAPGTAPGGARSFYSPPTRGQFPGRRATR